MVPSVPALRSPALAQRRWQAVVHLVGKLRGLTDFFYALPAHLPSFLLETLRLELPRCRLHHFRFRLRNLNGAYERVVVTAPCLYSIGDLGHNDDKAGRTLARRHAPHLTNVFVAVPDPNNDAAGDRKHPETMANPIYLTFPAHRKGYLTDVFVNSTIDEKLARSIFTVIDGAKRTIIGGRVIALEELQVAASNGIGLLPASWPYPYDWELSPWLHEALGQKWLVTRSVRDDERHVLHVRALCHHCRCVRFGTPQRWCRRAIDSHTLRSYYDEGPFAEVWSRLWPDKSDGRVWLNSWESWPLDLEPEVQ